MLLCASQFGCLLAGSLGAEVWPDAPHRHQPGLGISKRPGYFRLPPCADDDTSIAAHLLRLRDPATGQPLSDERLLPEIATLLIAGFDTSAHTMSWTLVGVPVCFKPSQRCLSWRLFTSAVHLLS